SSLKLASKQNYLMAGFIVGGILLALMIASFIASVISTSVKKLDFAARQIAHGEMDVHTESDSTDEIGNLMKSLQEIKNAIRAMESSIGTMATEQKAGDVEARCGLSGLYGSYNDIVQGVNDSLDKITLPIIESIGLM